MRTLIFLALCFAGAKCLAQLSGVATLEGSSNHSGIKITFVSSGGTAVTDSAVTDASGNYALNITGGLYKVTFSKQGYQTFFYNYGDPITLTNTVTMFRVNLLPGNVVSVSGNVSGTWSNANVYIVNGHATVAAGAQLKILPGTQVRFNGNYSLSVNGTLEAGQLNTSPVLFTSNKIWPVPGEWGGITLNGGQSHIQNCVIEYALHGVWLASGNSIIEHSEIRKFTGDGIMVHFGGTALVKNNHIYDFKYSQHACGISTYGSTSRIECNSIHDGSSRGIVLGDNSEVNNNSVFNIDKDGFSIYASSAAKVRNNIIHDCGNAGISIGETVETGPAPLIVNNTIYSNAKGILSTRFFSRPSIINNVIVSNTVGIAQDPAGCGICNTTPSVVANNLVWDNGTDYSGVLITSIGELVATNSNGHQVDPYFNLSQDPAFAGNEAPSLSPSSPCFGAGNTAHSSLVGADVKALCQGVITGIEHAESSELATLYPNPFSDFMIVNVPDKEICALEFYDINQKKIARHDFIQGSSTARAETSDLVPGIYFLKIEIKNDYAAYLRVIKH